MISVKEIKSLHKLEQVAEGYGIVFKKKGANTLTACCPFHKEKTPSFDVDLNQQLYHCFGCHAGGDVVTFVARMDNTSTGAALAKLTPEHLRDRPYNPPSKPPLKLASQQGAFVEEKPEIDINSPAKIYSYTDEFGTELFQVLRYIPKDFRQRHQDESGKWVWNMNGVRRVLYNLPNMLRSPVVCLCAGEKDADTINSIGLIATTNSGGESKWMDGYSEALTGKDVIIFGDNDEAGRNHVKKVVASLAGKVKSIRVCFMPKGKDVTAFKELLLAEGKTDKDFESELEKVVSLALPLERGIDLPIYSMAQMEVFYRQEVMRPDDKQFDLGKFLATLGRHIEPLIGGDLLVVMADTGVGKSFATQVMMRAANPLKCLAFQIELSKRRTFERNIAIDTGLSFKQIKETYKAGGRADWSESRMGHIFTVPQSKINTSQIEKLINQAEMVMGERPTIVVVDYAQLVEGVGKSSYEKISSVAEQLKVIAVATNTIIILTSQVGRSEDEQYKELGLHDAKNSGSIEQSATVLLGLYLDRQTAGKMYCKVLKDSNSDCAGLIVPCMRKGMTLVEVSIIDDADVPNR